MTTADRGYHAEEQLTLAGFPLESHALIRFARVGAWHRATCTCGWQSRVVPDRWRAVRQHETHQRWEATPIDDREPRP